MLRCDKDQSSIQRRVALIHLRSAQDMHMNMMNSLACIIVRIDYDAKAALINSLDPSDILDRGHQVSHLIGRDVIDDVLVVILRNNQNMRGHHRV